MTVGKTSDWLYQTQKMSLKFSYIFRFPFSFEFLFPLECHASIFFVFRILNIFSRPFLDSPTFSVCFLSLLKAGLVVEFVV